MRIRINIVYNNIMFFHNENNKFNIKEIGYGFKRKLFYLPSLKFMESNPANILFIAVPLVLLCSNEFSIKFGCLLNKISWSIDSLISSYEIIRILEVGPVVKLFNPLTFRNYEI